jgi:PAS domain S-box-containing protein
VELNLRYVQLDRGYVVIVARDITERKRAAEALRESEEKLRLIVENAFDGISIFEETPDPDQRRLIECNARYAEMAGRSREELLSIGNTRDLARPLSQDNTPSIQRGVAFRGTFTWLRPDEKDNIVEYTAVPIKMKGKTYTIGIDRDVTERKKAEENIQRALEWQEAIFEGSRDAVFISDNESRFVAVNKAACELTGYPKEELLKMRIPDLHEETDLEAYRRFHDRIMGGEEILSEAKILRKDGSKVDTEFSNTLIFIAGIPYEHTAARDITERKRAEEALSKERSLLRALMDNVPDHIYFKDADSRFITMSRAQADRFGLSDPSQVLGKTDFDFFTEEHARPAFEDEQKIIQTGQPIVGVEEKETWPDGRVTWVSTTKMPLRDKEGNIIGTFGISRDITERKRAEKALRDEKALMDALMDNIPDSIYFKDRQCRLVRINRKMMKDLKLEEVSQAVGKTDIELFGEEFGRKTMISDQHLIATGEPIVGLLESRQLEDGRINWTLTTKVPLRDEGGHITGLVGITSEINEFMRVQEALRENEQRLKVALTCADIAVFNQDKDLRYTWMFNPQLGFLPQEAIGKTDKDLFSRADVSMLTKIKQKVLETGVGAHEEVLMTLDHQEIVVLLNIEPLRDLSGAIIGLTGAMNDITQRKLAELEIRRNREWLQAILDASRDGILAEKDGTIAYANASFARIYGYDDPAELIGKHATVGLAPEESRRLMDFGRRRLLGESMPNAYEFKGIRKDGKAVELEASVSTARIAGDTHIITTVRDISERKLLQKQVVEAQKMESIGTLAGGIAHDFNNILGIIMGHSSILEQMRSDPDKFLRSVQAINKATFRGAGLVRQLLTFARKTEVTMQSVLINDTLSELAKLLGETLPKTIVMELNLEKKLPSILADPTQLHQVFLNLCVNARDAMMPKGGRLSITTRLASGEAVSTKFSRADATEYIVVNVADSGAGMDEATCSRIFEPFFTTKGKGKGTGLGLATVYGIIESHRGFIDVESTVGVGSTFHVYFPVEPRHVRPQEVEKAAEKDIPGGTETILVVEDEETLRNLICLVLEGKGYRVLQASDGEEGLQQFTEHQHEIALVLSDLGLPKMSGEDLLNTIRELKPEAKIILASGYAEPGIKSELLKSGAKEIIQKPYDPVEVLKKIREVLDTGR